MTKHICDAAIVTCIDFRFQDIIHNWTAKELANKTFDRISMAGSTKSLSDVAEQIDISVRLHEIKDIYLIHHEDCGAYGDESNLENHSRDLKIAKEYISKTYPDVTVHMLYAKLDGTVDTII